MWKKFLQGLWKKEFASLFGNSKGHLKKKKKGSRVRKKIYLIIKKQKKLRCHHLKYKKMQFWRHCYKEYS
jgi:hypothetical protein